MEWISVRDRLPEIGELVVVLGDSCQAREYEARYLGDGKWADPTDGLPMFYPVSQWRPRPPAGAEWISARVTRPRIGERVQVLRRQLSGAVDACLMSGFGEWELIEHDAEGMMFCDDVIHWRPLPEPPEPESWPVFSVTRVMACDTDYNAVYHESGKFVCKIADARTARAVCDTLIELWEQKGGNDAGVDGR